MRKAFSRGVLAFLIAGASVTGDLHAGGVNCVEGAVPDCDEAGGASCPSNVCLEGALADCDDSEIGAPCDDGQLCTAGDQCTEQGCVGAGQVSCDDSNLCTFDFCDPAEGCINSTVTCDDFNACTTDSCDANDGCIYQPIACDDGNECTSDSCGAASGCAFDVVPNDTPCTDGLCQDGQCLTVAN